MFRSSNTFGAIKRRESVLAAPEILLEGRQDGPRNSGLIPGPGPPPWRDRPICLPSLGRLQVPNSGRRVESWDWSRWMIDECICETRDSLRSSVAPISFIVSSS